MTLLAFHIAFAQNNVRPERSEMRNATLERSVVNFWGCISIYSTAKLEGGSHHTQLNHPHWKQA